MGHAGVPISLPNAVEWLFCRLLYVRYDMFIIDMIKPSEMNILVVFDNLKGNYYS